MIKYRTGQYTGAKIEKMEAERETDMSIWIDGRRISKRSTYWVFHESWSAAKQFLLDRAERKLASARSQLQSAQDELGNIKGLKEPA